MQEKKQNQPKTPLSYLNRAFGQRFQALMPRARRPPVQAYCGDDIASYVGAAFGCRRSISRRISTNSRDGIVT